jgi:predicted negative regulator of RcsB-dependent stress response
MLRNTTLKDRLTEELAVVVVVVAILAVGALAGWYARSVSSRDKWLISQAEQNLAQVRYYQTEMEKLFGIERDRRGESR